MITKVKLKTLFSLSFGNMSTKAEVKIKVCTLSTKTERSCSCLIAQPSVTLICKLQSEDNNTETESSPSGYETDSSSEDDEMGDDIESRDDTGDEDTDIDVVIDEYRSCSSLATISLSSIDQRGKKILANSM